MAVAWRNGVRGNAATAQRWAIRLSGLDVQLKPLLDGSPSHWPSEAIGQQWLIWFQTGRLQLGTDVQNGFLPQRYGALLSANALAQLPRFRFFRARLGPFSAVDGPRRLYFTGSVYYNCA
jgi:hypothetical protein